jgi:hypothetical protein
MTSLWEHDLLCGLQSKAASPNIIDSRQAQQWRNRKGTGLAIDTSQFPEVTLPFLACTFPRKRTF